MQEARVNYLWVGGFVLVAGFLFFTALAVLAGRTGATDSYHTVFERVTGISRGTRVLYNGYPVGQVERLVPIARDGRQRFRVELRLREGWLVAADSTVYVTSGLLSSVELDIRGQSAAGRLDPGVEIPSHESADVFAALNEAAGELAQLVDSRVAPLLEELSARMPAIASNLEAVSRDLSETSARINALFDEETVARVDQLLVNAELTSRGFAELSAELRVTRSSLDDTIRLVAETVEENRENVDQSLVDLRYSLESVARHIDTFNHNLEGTTRNMNEFSRQIRANPGLLLDGRPPPVSAGDR